MSYRSPDACKTCDGRGVVELTGKRSAACPTCGGQRTVYQDRKVEVSIPAGIENGKKLRVPGGGVRGTKGRAGDLFVIVKETPHPKFKRKGADLEVEIEVDYLAAALGVKCPGANFEIKWHDANSCRYPEWSGIAIEREGADETRF
ncbi:MAG: DnaJ C-terminal domain-containing protein [Fimbriimonadaceae bacterium]